LFNKIFKGEAIMSFITVKNLNFKYPNGTENVLNDVSLEVTKGEKVAIIGQNGAGKTTMVKMLNGLLKPVSGDVVVDDWNTKKYTVAKMSRKVGYVFQNPMDQIFHNNVYDEIAFGAKKLKYSPDETKTMVENAIKLTELEKYQKENPYNLPYSLRKFVTIAAVIAMGSDVIVMDEPTAGQDFRGMRVLHNLIDELQKQGKTIITITHDMEFVVKNFDRVIVMTNGEVIADGDKRDIFWQFDTLEKSMVKQPYISDLAKEMEIENDAKEILEIYRPYIENTTITFEYEVPSVKEFKERIMKILEEYPYIVCEYDKKIIGYAYAHRVWSRAAYQWDAELSVYTNENYSGNGIGKKLYKMLMEILKLQNVVNVYGCVTYPNENSDKLHEYLGFNKVGIFKNAGYKFGKWIGVTWFEKAILEHCENPKPLKKILDVDKNKIKYIFKIVC